MAKNKRELLKQGQAAGLVAEDADEEGYTVAQLEALLGGEIKAHERVSASEPIVAPDGHVTLSQEDIANRA